LSLKPFGKSPELFGERRDTAHLGFFRAKVTVGCLPWLFPG